MTSLHRIVVVALTLSTACAPARQSASEDQPPAWTSAKPVSDTYYIGIGRGIKGSNADPIQQAKRSALEDISSEIRVSISSVSVLSTVADDKQFYEKYEQVIKTIASDELEGYEQVAAWEDKTQYWVYYRLSKQRYREIKEAKRQDAITNALSALDQAQRYEADHNNVQAMAFYLKGLAYIEKYLIEPLRVVHHGRELLLTNELYTLLQRQLDGIHLIARPPQLSVRGRLADNPPQLIVEALGSGDVPTPSLPLRADFTQGAGDMLPQYDTDRAGQSKILIAKITARDKEQMVRVQVDFERLATDIPTSLVALLADRFRIPDVDILLDISRPAICVISSEDLAFRTTENQLANRVKNRLTTAGFTLVPRPDQAELSVYLNVSSERGAAVGSLFAAYASLNIRVVDLHGGREVYSLSLDRVREYSLDYARAELAAYRKLADEVDNTLTPKLIDALL